MFDLFSVKVKQIGTYVHITGVPFNLLNVDIGKLYNTSLVSRHMIRRDSWNTLKVHNFFLVELHKILKELLKLQNLKSRRRDLNELKLVLESDTWLKDTVNPVGKTFDFKKLALFNTVPFPQQREFLETYPVIVNSFHLRGLLLDSAVGSGKAHPLDTRVKTPTGWKVIGDVVIGDELLTPDGKVTKVTGVYPQGITAVYKFVFADGRSARSHPQHLWDIYYGKEPIRNTVTTEQIVNDFGFFQQSVPLVTEMPGSAEMLSVSELNRLAKELLEGNITVDEKIEELIYVDRLAIAKIMFNHQSPVDMEPIFTFYHVNEQAAINFQQLMWTVGGAAPIKRHMHYYHVDVAHPEFAHEDNDFHRPRDRLEIKQVTKEEPAETVCISVDSEEKLYVIDQYIVTHNTFTSIAWAELVTDNAKFVFCPKNIVEEVWINQLNKHYKVPPKIWTSTSLKPLMTGYDWYIVHYDYLQREGFAILKRFLTSLKALPVLIVDESHNMNEIKAKQTQRLIELADANVFEHALPMSGTALKAQGSEIFPTLCLIDKHFDKPAREFFMASYGRNRPALIDLLQNRIGRGKFTIPELVGMGPPPPFEIIKISFPGSGKYTLDAIKLEMQTYINDRLAFYDKNMPEMLRFYQETVSSYASTISNQKGDMQDLLKYKEIVNRFRTKGYNNFTDSSDSMFCKLVEERIESRLKGKELAQFRNVKSAVKYLGLKLRGEALGNVLGKARVNAIKDMIEHAGLPEMITAVEKKTVIFTSYIDSLIMTENYLRSKGFTPVTVYGENNHEREVNVRRFENDKTVNPLGATYKSLKEGYPLIMANQLISLDSPFRDHEIKQVQGRIWRTGQDAPCFFKMLDMDTGDKMNITTRSLDIMNWSKDQVDALLSRVEGHAILNNITGEEMWSMSEEDNTRGISLRNSALSIF